VRTIKYHSYRPGDEQAIIKLFWECGYTNHDQAFWYWINRQCPFGKTIIEVATVGTQVVGHYSILPRLVRIGGTVVSAGLAIHAAIHPEYRGLVILQELMKRIFYQCHQTNMAFIYGFPNNNAWSVYLKLFQWQRITELATLELPLDNFQAVGSNAPRISLRDELYFDDRYDSFQMEDLLSEKTYVVKDKKYLNWRYAHHPQVQYQLLEAETESGNLAGYLVLKLYRKNHIMYGHIIDLYFIRSDLHLFSHAVCQALSWFIRQGVDIASCWILKGTPFFEPLLDIGFRPIGFASHVGYRLIRPNFPVDKLNVDKWHMVMGDSDAF